VKNVKINDELKFVITFILIEIAGQCIRLPKIPNAMIDYRMNYEGHRLPFQPK